MLPHETCTKTSEEEGWSTTEFFLGSAKYRKLWFFFVESFVTCAFSDSSELGNDELHHPCTPVKLGFDISRLMGIMKKIATAHPCDQLHVTVGAVTQRTQKD